MNRPILDAIARFRSNRQDRIAERRGGIRGLLRPGRREGGGGPFKLLRSLGTGSSRQDMMPLRKNLLMPQDRVMQDYAHGPDTGPNAGKRPYDGDGNVDNPAMSLPAPIQGGVQDLPAADPYGITPLQKQYAGLQRRLAGGGHENANDLVGLQSAALMAGEQLGAAEQAKRDEQTYQRSRLPAQYAELSDLARAAAREGGGFEQFRAIFNSSPALFKQDENGQPVAVPNHAELLRPHVNEYLAENISQFGNLKSVPPAVRTRLMEGIIHSYPVTEFAGVQPGVTPDHTTSLRAAMRISDMLNRSLNLHSDPVAAEQYKDLAIQIVLHNGGRLPKRETAEWRQGSMPQMEEVPLTIPEQYGVPVPPKMPGSRLPY